MTKLAGELMNILTRVIVCALYKMCMLLTRAEWQGFALEKYWRGLYTTLHIKKMCALEQVEYVIPYFLCISYLSYHHD